MRDGAAGRVQEVSRRFAVLDDGSVVLSTSEISPGPNGLADSGTTTERVWKVAPGGEIAWSVAGGADVFGTLVVAREPEGGVLVGGSMRPGEHEALGAALTCPGTGACSFLVRLDAAGGPTWSKVLSAAPMNAVRLGHLAVTEDGRITVGGAFDGALDLGCGTLDGSPAIPGSLFGTRFVARLSSDGACLWSRAIVGAPTIPLASEDLAVDEAGEVAVVLTLLNKPGAETIDLGGGALPTGAEDGQALAVARYASNGDLVFARILSAGIVPVAPQIAFTTGGDVLLSATIEDVDPDNSTAGDADTLRHFVTRFGAGGEVRWTRDILTGRHAGSPALAVAPGGGFFLAGQRAPDTELLGVPGANTALFVAELDDEGEPLDLRTFPFNGERYAMGLSVGPDALVLAGGYLGTIELGQGPLVSVGLGDAYVAKICR
jgi:hypothetical protein